MTVARRRAQDELLATIDRARAAQPATGFDPADVELDERQLPAPARRRRRILGLLLAELALAADRGDDWYLWIRDEWPKRK